MSDFTLSRISKSDSWRTPAELYASLDAEFHFDDDPCPIGGVGGLDRQWGKSVFVNPPYSNPLPWCRKAYEESQRGSVVVGLLRGDTSTRWFHEWVLGKAEIRFLPGRLHFEGKGPAPFPSIIAIWRGGKARAASFYEAVAEAVRDTEIDTVNKCDLVKKLCAKLKAQDARFDAARFSEACWNESEW